MMISFAKQDMERSVSIAIDVFADLGQDERMDFRSITLLGFAQNL